MKFLKVLFKLFLVGIILVVLALVGVFFARNALITTAIEKSVGSAYGAKADLTGFNLDVFEGKVVFERFELANRDKTSHNLFEIGKTEFAINIMEVIKGQTIIEMAKVTGLQIDTKRDTDGFLPESEKVKLIVDAVKDMENKLKTEKNLIPVFNPKKLKTEIKPDDLFKALKLESPAKIDSVVKVVEARIKFWEKRVKQQGYVKKYKVIEKTLKTINVKKIKKAKDVEKLLVKIDKAWKDAEKLYKTLEADSKEAKKDLAFIKHVKNELPKWIKNDYEKALRLAELPEAELGNIGMMLFGPTITEQLLAQLNNVNKVKQVASSVESKDKKANSLFWIKEIELSGRTPDDIIITGKVFNVSSNQDKAKKPLTASLNLVQKGKFTGKVNLVLDQRNGGNLTKADLIIDDIKFKNMKLSSFALLPKRIKSGTAKLKASLLAQGKKTDVDIDFNIGKIVFDFNKASDKYDKNIHRIATRLAKSIKSININAECKTAGQGFSWKLRSNIDRQIKNELDKVFAEEIAKAKRKVKAYLDAKLKPYVKKLEKHTGKDSMELMEEIIEIMNSKNGTQKLKKRLEKEIKKALQKEAEKQIEKKVGKEAGKFLKGLFD